VGPRAMKESRVFEQFANASQREDMQMKLTCGA